MGILDDFANGLTQIPQAIGGGLQDLFNGAEAARRYTAAQEAAQQARTDAQAAASQPSAQPVPQPKQQPAPQPAPQQNFYSQPLGWMQQGQEDWAHAMGNMTARDRYNTLLGLTDSNGRQLISPQNAAAILANPEAGAILLPQLLGPKVNSVVTAHPGDVIYSVNPWTNKATALAGQDGETDKTPQGRQAIADRLGIDPRSIAYKNYVLGKDDLKLDTAGIKDMTLQMRQANQLEQDLTQALALNEKAYSGWFANARAGVMNNTVPTDRSQATIDMENIIDKSILPQLKTTFPGRITNTDLNYIEGLQPGPGQPNLTPAGRKTILERSLQIVRANRDDMQNELQQMRSGDFYSPGGFTPSSRVGPQPNVAPQPTPQAWKGVPGAPASPTAAAPAQAATAPQAEPQPSGLGRAARGLGTMIDAWRWNGPGPAQPQQAAPQAAPPLGTYSTQDYAREMQRRGIALPAGPGGT
jgi:hypothetical protein